MANMHTSSPWSRNIYHLRKIRLSLTGLFLLLSIIALTISAYCTIKVHLGRDLEHGFIATIFSILLDCLAIAVFTTNFRHQENRPVIFIMLDILAVVVCAASSLEMAVAGDDAASDDAGSSAEYLKYRGDPGRMAATSLVVAMMGIHTMLAIMTCAECCGSCWWSLTSVEKP